MSDQKTQRPMIPAVTESQDLIGNTGIYCYNMEYHRMDHHTEQRLCIRSYAELQVSANVTLIGNVQLRTENTYGQKPCVNNQGKTPCCRQSLEKLAFEIN